MVEINTHWKHEGEVLRFIRDSQNRSQEEVALTAKIDRSALSDIETGQKKPTTEQLIAPKKALKIEYLPIFENELSEFLDELFSFNRDIGEGKFEKAKATHEKLAVVKLVPRYKELNIYFSIFESRLLLCFGDFATVEENFKYLDEIFENFGDVQQYYYSYVKGNYFYKKKLDDDALVCYEKVHELMKRGLEKNINVYDNASACCRRNGYTSRSIAFLEEACSLISQGYACNYTVDIYNDLGVDYIDTKNFQRAGELLQKAHLLADEAYTVDPTDENKRRLGIVIFNIGYFFQKAKKSKRAIRFFDKALPYINKESDLYMKAIYHKARASKEMGDMKSCTELINEGKKISKGSEEYAILFDALSLLMYPKDEYVAHINGTVIPYLLKVNFIYAALDYAILVRDYYVSKKRHKSKVQKMSDVIYTIQSKIYEGSFIECGKKYFDF